MLSWLQAVVVGLTQGATELFPVSSLGHSVLLPAWLGWHNLVGAQSAGESFYLAFLVGLHVATALALLGFFHREWLAILRGLIGSLVHRRVASADERLAWLLVLATIPAGLVGLAFEHALRVLFARPLAAAVFLTCNGAVLLLGERLRRRGWRRAAATSATGDGGPGPAGGRGAPHGRVQLVAGSHARVEQRLATLGAGEALLIGSAQILAFFAGISRSGVTMVAGLLRGLDHEDAARFSFLLATPIILLAGLYKLPDLLGPNGDGVRGQVLAGSVVAGVVAWLSVRFLTRWFTTRTLTPFAVYCLVAGVASILRFV